jgi:putative alpha-1,2-mannosidase
LLTSLQLKNGANLDFEMTSTPVNTRGIAETSAPYSFSDEIIQFFDKTEKISHLVTH